MAKDAHHGPGSARSYCYTVVTSVKELFILSSPSPGRFCWHLRHSLQTRAENWAEHLGNTIWYSMNEVRIFVFSNCVIFVFSNCVLRCTISCLTLSQCAQGRQEEGSHSISWSPLKLFCQRCCLVRFLTALKVTPSGKYRVSPCTLHPLMLRVHSTWCSLTQCWETSLSRYHCRISSLLFKLLVLFQILSKWVTCALVQAQIKLNFSHWLTV